MNLPFKKQWIYHSRSNEFTIQEAMNLPFKKQWIYHSRGNEFTIQELQQKLNTNEFGSFISLNMMPAIIAL